MVKQALVEAAQGDSENDRAILRACIGLLFFGVPNRGLNSENLESLVKNQRNAPFVAGLQEGSELLRMLHRGLSHTYQNSLTPCFVASFYENQDTSTVEVGG